MKSRLATAFVTAILAGIGVGRMSAQESPENPLDKLSWLIGGKWVADIKSPKGEALTVETTIEWTGHKKALKYSVVFKTTEAATPQYEGMYWWNPAKKRVSLLQIDRAGNMTEALVRSRATNGPNKTRSPGWMERNRNSAPNSFGKTRTPSHSRRLFPKALNGSRRLVSNIGECAMAHRRNDLDAAL